MILIMAAASFPLCAEDSEIQFMKHESKEAGYSIELPLDWDIKTSVRDYDCVAFAPKAPMAQDEFLDNVTISFLEDKDKKGLDSFSEAFVANLKARSPAFSLVSEKKLKVADCEALRLDYSYALGGVQVRSSALFVARDGHILVLSFNAEPKRYVAKKQLFDKIEASFRPL